MIKYNRVWAMPDKWTFKIEPIAKLIARYVGDGTGWIDPFAGENSPAEITNDLNPNRPTKYHIHAKDFSRELQGNFKGTSREYYLTRLILLGRQKNVMKILGIA